MEGMDEAKQTSQLLLRLVSPSADGVLLNTHWFISPDGKIEGAEASGKQQG